MTAADRRLLLVCPHPDDETLAAGLLLQNEVASGNDVRVVYLTDGENNPIPQWLAERSVNRERWARRRREEALAALAILGVRSDAVEFLGFADQKLRAAMPQLTQRLAESIRAYQPTVIIAPSTHDLHDDHLIAAYATAAANDRHDVEHYTYVVHGRGIEVASFAPEGDAIALRRKSAALECHASQLIASRGRMEAICHRDEAFRPFSADIAIPAPRFRAFRRIVRVLFERDLRTRATSQQRPVPAPALPSPEPAIVVREGLGEV